MHSSSPRCVYRASFSNARVIAIRCFSPPQSSALRTRLSGKQNIFPNYFGKPIQSISARPRCSVSKLKYVTIKNPHNDDKYARSLLYSQPKDTAKRQYLTFLIAQANLYRYHSAWGCLKSWLLFRHPREFKIKFLHNNYLILNIALKSKEAVQKLKFLDSPVPNSDKTVQGKTVSL